MVVLYRTHGKRAAGVDGLLDAGGGLGSVYHEPLTQHYGDSTKNMEKCTQNKARTKHRVSDSPWRAGRDLPTH